MKPYRLPAYSILWLRAFVALSRAALAGVSLALVACGGGTDTPPSPEGVPTAVAQPADQSVVDGTAATFTVTAAGTAPLAYQWFSSTDGVNFTAIAGATSASFSTGATTLAQDSTHYRVVVSNGLGSVTSSAATLTVTPAVVAPVVLAQPADQAVVAPASATFNVTATGSGLSYDWQVSTDGGTTFTDVVGAPDVPSLTISNSAVGQSGQRYRVQISNRAGSVTSNPALLTVTERRPPQRSRHSLRRRRSPWVGPPASRSSRRAPRHRQCMASRRRPTSPKAC